MAKKIEKNQIKKEDSMEALCLEFAVSAAAFALAVSFSAAVLAPYIPEDLKQKINQAVNTDLDAHRKNVAEFIDNAPENVRQFINHIAGPEQNSSEQRRYPRKSATDKCKAEKINIGGFEFTLPC